MKRLIFPVRLSSEELQEVIVRNHFEARELGVISGIYEQLRKIVTGVTVFYHVSECTEQEVDSGLSRGRLAVIVTLGKGIDEFQEQCKARGKVRETFIVDCLGLKILEKAYGLLGEILWKRNGLGMGRMIFPGTEYPLEKIPEIFAQMPQNEVTYNEALVLIPLKSVVFLAEISPDQTKLCNICAACGNTKCSSRKI